MATGSRGCARGGGTRRRHRRLLRRAARRARRRACEAARAARRLPRRAAQLRRLASAGSRGPAAPCRRSGTAPGSCSASAASTRSWSSTRTTPARRPRPAAPRRVGQGRRLRREHPARGGRWSRSWGGAGRAAAATSPGRSTTAILKHAQSSRAERHDRSPRHRRAVEGTAWAPSSSPAAPAGWAPRSSTRWPSAAARRPCWTGWPRADGVDHVPGRPGRLRPPPRRPCERARRRRSGRRPRSSPPPAPTPAGRSPTAARRLGARRRREPARHRRRRPRRAAAPRAPQRHGRHGRLDARPRGRRRRHGVLRVASSASSGSPGRWPTELAGRGRRDPAGPGGMRTAFFDGRPEQYKPPGRTPCSTTRPTSPRRSSARSASRPAARCASWSSPPRRSRPGRDRDPGRRVTVLVLRALGLGDCSPAVAALRGLRRRWPDAELARWPPRSRSAGCCRGSAWSTPCCPPPGCATPPRRRAAAPDVAVNLHGRGPQSHRRSGRRWMPAALVAFRCPEAGVATGPAWQPDEHEVERWCRLVSAAGGAAATGRTCRAGACPACSPPPRTRCWCTRVPPRRSRRWPAGRWAAVVRVPGRRGAPSWPSPGCRPSRPAVPASRLRSAARRDLVRPARPAELAGAGRLGAAAGLRRHRRGPPGDGLRHALGPAVRPTHPAHWGPAHRPELHHVIWHPRRERPTGRPARRCEVDVRLARTGVDEVLDAARRLLERRPATA